MLCPGGKPLLPGGGNRTGAVRRATSRPRARVAKAVRVDRRAPCSSRRGRSKPPEGKKFVDLAEPLVRAQGRPGAQRARHHQPASRAPTKHGGSGQPNVSFGFTEHGKTVFERVTKEIAERGRNALLPGVSKANSVQHFAIVLDGQLITVPSIDFEQYPDGNRRDDGSEISGGFTISSAQELASELQSGALPIRLALISRSQVSATLGKQALKQALVAGLVGFLIVCVFLLALLPRARRDRGRRPVDLRRSTSSR